MDLRSGPTGEPAGEPRILPRQRWRLVLARSEAAPGLSGRELSAAWDQAIAATGLPLHRGPGQERGRVAWGAPLSAAMVAEHELGDILLTELLPTWRVRAALEANLPEGWRLVDLYDVWLGAPALASRVTGAVYRVTLEGNVGAARIAAAARRLLVAASLTRTRLKGGAPVAYDLRPLLAGIDVVQPGPPVIIRIETRIHPERGSGRPEEVAAAIAEEVGDALACASIVRERLILADDGG